MENARRVSHYFCTGSLRRCWSRGRVEDATASESDDFLVPNSHQLSHFLHVHVARSVDLTQGRETITLPSKVSPRRGPAFKTETRADPLLKSLCGSGRCSIRSTYRKGACVGAFHQKVVLLVVSFRSRSHQGRLASTHTVRLAREGRGCWGIGKRAGTRLSGPRRSRFGPSPRAHCTDSEELLGERKKKKKRRKDGAGFSRFSPWVLRQGTLTPPGKWKRAERKGRGERRQRIRDI